MHATTVDYRVYGPATEPGKERIVLEGEKERQGDFVFTANDAGEYRFCFDNSMSTISDKLVDFEIAVRLLNHAAMDGKGHTADHIYGYRSRTKSAPNFRQSLAPHLNNSAAWKRPSSSSQAKCQRSTGSRSTSAQERTGISAQSEVRRGESSTLA